MFQRMSRFVPSTSSLMKLRRIRGSCAVPIISATCGMTANIAGRASSWCRIVPKTRSTRSKKRMRSMILSGRGIKQFHFTGNASEPEEALRAMLEFDGSPCFLSDSGDNVTAGAPGVNTTMLKQVLALNDFHNKSILFAAICDPQLCATVLTNKKAGEPVDADAGCESGRSFCAGFDFRNSDIDRRSSSPIWR